MVAQIAMVMLKFYLERKTVINGIKKDRLKSLKVDCTAATLKERCFFAALVHAIAVARFPQIGFEQSWSGVSYNMNDGAGQRGTISFSKDGCTAAFRNESSERMHWEDNGIRLLRDLPKKLSSLMENETLEFLLDDVQGCVRPVITAAFWGRDSLFSFDALDELKEHGASLLTFQLLEIERAESLWQEYYEMTKEQINLAKSLFVRKMHDSHKQITLTEFEVAVIDFAGEEGKSESSISFGELGVYYAEG